MQLRPIREAEYFDQRRAPSVLRFLGHLFEMVVVMMLGMCLLGGALSAIHLLLFGSGNAAAWRDHVALAAFGMAFNMTVPMVLWMRFRGHSWQRGREMAVAMNLPLLLLIALYGVGAIPARSVLGLQMLLMLPAMVGVMLYRKEEYSAPQPTRTKYGRRIRSSARRWSGRGVRASTFNMKEAPMIRNMGSLDRGVRAFVVAPVAIVLAFVVGASTVAGVILFVVAGIMVATSAIGFCPNYVWLGITTRPRGVRRVGHHIRHA